MKKLIFIITFVALSFGCQNNSSSGGGGSPAPGAGSPQDPNNPNKPQDGMNPQPDPQKPDYAQLWKSYRMFYTILEKDGVDLCAKKCGGQGFRSSSVFYDSKSLKTIPQLVAWKLYTKYSENGTSIQVNFPVFADRGDFKEVDGKLIFDFAGEIGVLNLGATQAQIHIELESVSLDQIKLKANIQAGQSFSGEWILQKNPGTEMRDPPQRHSGGKIAFYESMQNDPQQGGLNGWRCSFDLPKESSEYVLIGNVKLVRRGQETPVQGVLFRIEYGLYPLLDQVWDLSAVETSEPNARRWEYASAFLPDGNGFKEIPLYGNGPRQISTVSPLQYQAKAKLKELCDKTIQPPLRALE